MLRLLKLVFIIVLVFLFFGLVIARTPAEWGAWAVHRAAPQVVLSGVTGTLWSGRAASAQVIIEDQSLDLGTLNWTLNRLPLLTSRACMRLESFRLNGDVCHGIFSGNTTVRQMTLDEIPASLLDRHVYAQMAGTASLTLQKAVINAQGNVRELDGNLVWLGARVNYGEGWLNMGSYVAEFTENNNGGARVLFTDTDGDFEVNLTGDYTPGGDPAIQGYVKPRPTAAAMIVNALSFMAEADDSGAYRLAWPMEG